MHLVMELCSGGELFDRIIEKGNYSEREAATVMRQIVNVVHICNFMGVMHRDLKPENFLLATKDENAAVKATDFGLSLFIEEGHYYLISSCFLFFLLHILASYISSLSFYFISSPEIHYLLAYALLSSLFHSITAFIMN